MRLWATFRFAAFFLFLLAVFPEASTVFDDQGENIGTDGYSRVLLETSKRSGGGVRGGGKSSSSSKKQQQKANKRAAAYSGQMVFHSGWMVNMTRPMPSSDSDSAKCSGLEVDFISMTSLDACWQTRFNSYKLSCRMDRNANVRQMIHYYTDKQCSTPRLNVHGKLDIQYMGRRKKCSTKTNSYMYCTSDVNNAMVAVKGVQMSYFQSRSCERNRLIAREVWPVGGCVNIKSSENGDMYTSSLRVTAGCATNSTTNVKSGFALYYPLPYCQGVGVASPEKSLGVCQNNEMDELGFSLIANCNDGVPTSFPTPSPSTLPTTAPSPVPTVSPSIFIPTSPSPTQTTTKPTSAPIYGAAQVFPYTGSNATYLVPPNTNFLLVKMWGGGGGGSYTSATQPVAFGGGAGGYTQCYLQVTPGTSYNVIVGGGGATGSLGANSAGGYGGGGTGKASLSTSFNTGGGGGRSAIQSSLANVDLATAGGGGGGGGTLGGCTSLAQGGGGGGLVGLPGGGGKYPNEAGPNNAAGGTQTSGGAATNSSAFGNCGAGAQYTGGVVVAGTNGGLNGGGGGGGFFGGASGQSKSNNAVSGGGGGSGYVGGCLATATAFTAPGGSGSGSNSSGTNQASTFNSVDASYVIGVALGGIGGLSTASVFGSSGGNGLVYIQPLTALPSTFSAYFTGSLQMYTVPAGTSYLFVKLWGAGGSGGSDSSTNGGSGGGAGGYTQCYLPVTSGQSFNVIVGGGGTGTVLGRNSIGGYGGGGDGKSGNDVLRHMGAGGGRSSIQKPGPLGGDLVTAGGGGGGGGFASNQYNPGGGGGGLIGTSVFAAGGGNKTAGGIVPRGPYAYGVGGAGSLYYGGVTTAGTSSVSAIYGAGGGGGLYGGASGSTNSTNQAGGGGGGSGFIGGCLASASAFTASGSSGNAWSGGSPFQTYTASTYNMADPYYTAGVALGGAPAASTVSSFNMAGNGGNGLVVIMPMTSAPPPP